MRPKQYLPNVAVPATCVAFDPRLVVELALDETLRRDRVSLGLLLGALWRDRATPRVAGRGCVGGLRSSAIDRFSCPGRGGRLRSRALRCLDGRRRRCLCARRSRLHRRRWRCGRIRRHCSRSSVWYLLRPARIRAWLRIRGRAGRSLGRGSRPSARRGVRRWRTPRAFGYPVDRADCSDQERGEQESACAVTTAFRVDRAIPTESARWPFFAASGRLAGERCCRRGWVIDSTRRFGTAAGEPGSSTYAAGSPVNVAARSGSSNGRQFAGEHRRRRSRFIDSTRFAGERCCWGRWLIDIVRRFYGGHRRYGSRVS